MIVVKVELWSAVTGIKTELARMHISNAGGTANSSDYRGETFIGRSTKDLDRGRVSKPGHLLCWPRKRLHVWNMVQAMLTNMGYGP